MAMSSVLGFAPGTAEKRVEFIQLKMVLLAPIPRARVTMAVSVKAGAFRSWRIA
jgi:hypothetical protein